FDDNHDTGIYSWEYLHELGATYDERWQHYLHRLEEAGHKRKPDA
ncbi:MAG: 1-(5-phosphoribosyl)-5-((5-phosphoribosylamino)methylideneamino)imidazole-4-carboxamide isomerase, partial [Gammaproteobacteria bacterium]